MAYASLRACIDDLYRNKELVILEDEVDPHLEMAAIQRRVYAGGGPAILFQRVKGSPFPAVSNIYGTSARMRFVFRHTLRMLERLVSLKADPTLLLRHTGKYLPAAMRARFALPRPARMSVPVLHGTTQLSALPQIVSWKDDGGAFVTLPQVVTFPPGVRHPMQANVGMYRIQVSGNAYTQDQEAGMHYQIHRGIGVHHTLYNTSDEPFRVTISVGGPPAHAFAAVMPLPEGLSELTFAGLLAGRRFRYTWHNDFFISADADFCITGTIQKGDMKPEGPFGDHLGYYSLKHLFPVLKVDNVYHRKDPIWHFTVVGRPPQEDTSFGQLIHEIAGPLLSSEFPGIREVNAVDAAGVHPLLLAIGSERYMPFRDKRPEEILTQANHLLGKGQTSLAKYLVIAADGDDPELSTHRIEEFFAHVLSRIDLARDLHFQTETTIDTLDYSGTGMNAGSKLVIAAAGDIRRELGTVIPELNLPIWVSDVKVVSKGILAFTCRPHKDDTVTETEIKALEDVLDPGLQEKFPLIILADDAEFVARTFSNFLWVAFTRSNPSHDVHGIGATIRHKHWGCTGPLLIDARMKAHHAPVLEEDPEVTSRIERFFRAGAPLAGY